MAVWRLWLLFRLSFEEALGHAVGPVPVGIFLENLLDFSLNSLDRFERGLYDQFGWRSIKEEAPLAANTAASGRRAPSTPLRIGETRRRTALREKRFRHVWRWRWRWRFARRRRRRLKQGGRGVRFEHLSTRQGLSRAVVYDILQDSRGVHVVRSGRRSEPVRRNFLPGVRARPG